MMVNGSHVNGSKSIGILYKLKYLLPLPCLKILYYSFIYPYLLYCVNIWGGTFASYLKPLFILQKNLSESLIMRYMMTIQLLFSIITVSLSSLIFMFTPCQFICSITTMMYSLREIMTTSPEIGIVVTGFLSILNQMDFHFVQNRGEDCHRDHIPFTVGGDGDVVFSV